MKAPLGILRWVLRVCPGRWLQGVLAVLCLGAGSPARGGEEGRDYVFGPAAPDQLPEAVPIELTLRDAVERALAVNYGVTIQRLETRISEANVLGERGRFEPALFGSAGRESLDATNGTVRSDSGEAGLRTRWITGTELALKTRYDQAGEEADGTARAVAELRQPLLKDAGIAVNRANLVMARRQRDISEQELQRQMMDTAAAIQEQYWSLVAGRESLAAQEESLKWARDLADLTAQRAAAGLLGESDTVQAQAAVFARQADAVRAAEYVRSIEDHLKEMLGLTEDPSAWNAPVVPTTAPALDEANMDFLAALKTALEHRPDYRAELLRLKNADLALYAAKNGLLPRLDLVLRAGQSSAADGPGDALKAWSGDDETVWGAFLSVEIPLGNKAARAGRDRALAEQEQELLRLKQLELRIIREVRRAVDALNTSRVVVEVRARAVDFEKKKLENERTRMELGKSDTDTVVRYIESLNNARLNYVQAVVDHNQAIIRLEQSQGTTLTEYGVTLE